MGRLTIKDARALAVETWGNIHTVEGCTLACAWAFTGENGAGIIADESMFDHEDRLLIDPYIQPTSGAFVFKGDNEMAIAGFVSRIFPLSETDAGVITKDMHLHAELTFRREYFNPRLAAYNADLCIEEHPELTEASDLSLEEWCAHHEREVSYNLGSAFPAMEDIWYAARRVAHPEAEIEPQRELEEFGI